MPTAGISSIRHTASEITFKTVFSLYSYSLSLPIKSLIRFNMRPELKCWVYPTSNVRAWMPTS